MKTLIIEGLRCFRSPGPIPLAPLTLLVGDNGAGKTTLLACARLAARLAASGGRTPDLDEAPFPLGAYVSFYTVGFECDASPGDPRAHPACSVVGRFDRGGSGLTVLGELRVRTDPDAEAEVFTREEKAGGEGEEDDEDEVARYVADRLRPVSSRYGDVYASDPAVPFWTRDPRPYTAGLDIACIQRRHGGERRELLKAALADFGRASRLFSEVDTWPQEGQAGQDGAFQIGLCPSFLSLGEQGRGVSHVLPLILQVLLTEPGALCLLQQPDAHLHPRAQAALGTLLGALVKIDRKQLIVETHSEHLIDRVRADVRDSHLRPEDVRILFLERQGDEVTVHPMGVDAGGALQDAPAGYRRFFMHEERREPGG